MIIIEMCLVKISVTSMLKEKYRIRLFQHKFFENVAGVDKAYFALGAVCYRFEPCQILRDL